MILFSDALIKDVRAYCTSAETSAHRLIHTEASALCSVRVSALTTLPWLVDVATRPAPNRENSVCNDEWPWQFPHPYYIIQCNNSKNRKFYDASVIINNSHHRFSWSIVIFSFHPLSWCTNNIIISFICHRDGMYQLSSVFISYPDAPVWMLLRLPVLRATQAYM